jgi:polysaccharide export outer membrane protein
MTMIHRLTQSWGGLAVAASLFTGVALLMQATPAVAQPASSSAPAQTAPSPTDAPQAGQPRSATPDAPQAGQPAVIEDPQVIQFLSTYRLGSGDVLSVRIFGEPELSSTGMRLTDSGTVFLPTIGELKVGGLTLGEIEKLVADRLRGRILINPRVSVSVDQYRPFFINGMVKSPGAYPYQPGLTVRKATSLSGGLQERASLRKIFVIRADDPKQSSVRIDIDTRIFPGDIVTIEESFF